MGEYIGFQGRIKGRRQKESEDLVHNLDSGQKRTNTQMQQPECYLCNDPQQVQRNTRNRKALRW